MSDSPPGHQPNLPNRLAHALVSERFVLGAILVNTLALVVMASTDDETPLARAAERVDLACVAFFVLEAALKVRLRGWAAYWASNWNRFDLTLVILSSPVLLSPLVDLHHFAVVLVLRLGRLFRLFRLLRFIPNRDHLLAGIRRSLRAAVGVVLALLLLNFILGVGATFLFARLDPDHFGNPLLSCYTMFQVFTVEGWPDIPARLAEKAGDPVWGILARAFFSVAVLVGGIVGLSLANAVFVDEMTSDNNDELTAKVDALRADLADLRRAMGLPPAPPPGDPPRPA
jgi:voltage-gated sodium channel